MPTDNLALAERIEATHCESSFGLGRCRPCGCKLEECVYRAAARALRESAQQGSEWGWHKCRDGQIKSYSWVFCNFGCTPEGVTPLIGPVKDRDDALAAAQAEGFQRGVEAEREKIRRLPCYCAVVPELLRKYEMRTRGLSGLGIEFGAHSSDCPHYLLPPPTGAETETHKFVEHPRSFFCGHRLPNGLLCGEAREYAIHATETHEFVQNAFTTRDECMFVGGDGNYCFKSRSHPIHGGR